MSPATQGAGSNYTHPRIEPPDHGIGRSRGGLTTKIHHLVDGAGRPLVVLVSAGQANDAPVFEPLMAHLRVKRPGSGRARTRPDRVRADKAYSSRAIRTELRRRGITTVIPEPSDQIEHRKRRGPRGGRPAAFDAADYQWAQCDRAPIQLRQTMARPGHPLRQTRHHLPRRRRPPRHHHLDSPFIRHALVASGRGTHR
jgi:transposase